MQNLSTFDFKTYVACFDHLNKQNVTNREAYYITSLLHNSHSKPNTQFLYNRSAISLFNYLLSLIQEYSHTKSNAR